MGSPRRDSLLYAVSFTRSVEEIRSGCLRKIEDLKSLVRERQQRISRYCDEYKISQDDLVGLFAQAQRDPGKMSYSTSRVVNEDDDEGEQTASYIPAGVVSAIRAERENLENERLIIRKLELTATAIRPIRVIDNGQVITQDWFPVGADDVEFLGL